MAVAEVKEELAGACPRMSAGACGWLGWHGQVGRRRKGMAQAGEKAEAGCRDEAEGKLGQGKKTAR